MSLAFEPTVYTFIKIEASSNRFSGTSSGNHQRKQRDRYRQEYHGADGQRPVNPDQASDHADRNAAEGPEAVVRHVK